MTLNERKAYNAGYRAALRESETDSAYDNICSDGVYAWEDALRDRGIFSPSGVEYDRERDVILFDTEDGYDVEAYADLGGGTTGTVSLNVFKNGECYDHTFRKGTTIGSLLDYIYHI